MVGKLIYQSTPGAQYWIKDSCLCYATLDHGCLTSCHSIHLFGTNDMESIKQWIRLSIFRTRNGETVHFNNRPFLLCLCFKTSLSAKPFVWEWVLHAVSFNANQRHFHKNGFALRLALKRRHKGTRKCKYREFQVSDISEVSNRVGWERGCKARLTRALFWLTRRLFRLMYQSNRSFNIPPPPANPRAFVFFGKFLFKFPPPEAK